MCYNCDIPYSVTEHLVTHGLHVNVGSFEAEVVQPKMVPHDPHSHHDHVHHTSNQVTAPHAAQDDSSDGGSDNDNGKVGDDVDGGGSSASSKKQLCKPIVKKSLHAELSIIRV